MVIVVVVEAVVEMVGMVEEPMQELVWQVVVVELVELVVVHMVVVAVVVELVVEVAKLVIVQLVVELELVRRIQQRWICSRNVQFERCRRCQLGSSR